MFLLLASLLSVACSSKPAPPVESFYQAIGKGNTEQALAHISFADVTANDMLRAKHRAEIAIDAITRKINANDGLENIEVLESALDESGKAGSVRLLLTYANGKQETTTLISTIHEKGAWKLAESTVPLAAFGPDIGAIMSKFFEAGAYGDYDKFVEVISSVSRAKFEANIWFLGKNNLMNSIRDEKAIAEFEARGGLKTTEVMQLEFDERSQTARVSKGRLVFNNGEERIDESSEGGLTFILENGAWKLRL